MPSSKLNKKQLIEELIGKKPESNILNAGRRVQWDKDSKSYGKLTVAELRSRVEENRRQQRERDDIQQLVQPIYQELKSIAEQAGNSWRTALKAEAEKEGVTLYAPQDATRGEAAATLAQRIAEKRYRQSAQSPIEPANERAGEGAGRLTPALSGGKEPWEMTREEFANAAKSKPYLKSDIFARGKEAVKSAQEAIAGIIERAKSGSKWTSSEVQSLADLLGFTIEKEKAYLMGSASGESGSGKISVRSRMLDAGKIREEHIGTVLHEMGHELLHSKSGSTPWEIESGKPLVRGEWAIVEKMSSRDRAPWHKNRNVPYTANRAIRKTV